MDTSELKKYIVPGKRAHLIGIGGVSMSPLAEVLLSMGLAVTGSDMNDGASVAHLRSLGIPVTIGHFGETVEGADFIVRTAAVHDENPEIQAAFKAGIPVFERAQAWGFIMLGYKNALCISGTHGKTTTTSMCTHIFMAAHRDPTVMIGGTLPLLNAGHRVGAGDTIIAESCEYCDSFLSFFPTVAVILDVDEDHLDYFSGLDSIKASFRKFASSVPEDGYIVANGDDANTVDTVSGIDRRIVTYGLGENADVRAVNVTAHTAHPEFDVTYKGEFFAHVRLNVPGAHNVLNACAACASAIVLGISGDACAEGLAGFKGAGRRFEFKGTYNGADVYDDYAHHPNEIRALLNAVRDLGYKRVVAAFQPHTYTRTKALFSDFVDVLKIPDVLYLAEIFAAREQNTIGISSNDIAKEIEGSVFCPTFDEMIRKLRSDLRPGDIFITIGAGDVYKVGEALL